MVPGEPETGRVVAVVDAGIGESGDARSGGAGLVADEELEVGEVLGSNAGAGRAIGMHTETVGRPSAPASGAAPDAAAAGVGATS